MLLVGPPWWLSGKESSCQAEVPPLGQKDSLEKEVVTHSSILSWRIPWTEAPGGLQSMGLQRARWLSDWAGMHVLFSSVQSLSRVWLFATPWTATLQTSLSITNSWSLLKLLFIESVKPSNSLMLCSPLLLLPSILPSTRVFSKESVLIASGGQSTGVSASASVLPMNTQDWFPLGLTGWISLQSKGLSRAISNTTVQKHQFFGGPLSWRSISHIHTWLLGKP